MSGAWSDRVEQLAQRSHQELLSRQAFEGLLRDRLSDADSPFANVLARISRADPYPEMVLGAAGSGESSHRETIHFGREDTTGVLDFWAREGGVDHSDHTAVRNAIEAYYAVERRTSVHVGLKCVLAGQTRAAAAASVLSMVETRGAASLLFADLDHLGALNARLGQSTTDKVIARIGALIAGVVPADCIPLHRSGDEFYVLCPGAAERAITIAYALHRALDAEDLGIGETVSMSTGICAVSSGDAWLTLSDLEDAAEEALKPRAGGEPEASKARRGRASLAHLNAASGEVPSLAEAAHQDLALAQVKSGCGEAAPFADPWLNALSLHAYEALASGHGASEVGLQIVAFLEWLGVEWGDGFAVAAGLRVSEGYGPAFSVDDAALALAHSALRAGFSGAQAAAPDDEITAGCSPSADAVLLRFGAATLISHGAPPAQLSIGGPILAPAGHEGIAESRRILLVKIGHAPLGGLETIFADVVTVDDRPVFGGGLPDFWEASIARIVDRLGRYPDVSLVAVLGAVPHGEQTVALLSDAKTWPQKSESLAARTGLTETAILAASRRLEGCVRCFDDLEALVSAVATTLRPGAALTPVTPEADALSGERFLTLRADMTEYDLPARLGCIVESGSRAYPVVLQRLREADTPTVQDAAGIPMVDLIDFRIHVHDPTALAVPAFYSEDADRLESYYQSVFQDAAEGLFATRLAPQLPRFQAHLVHAITRDRPFSTRRAIMIVPHDLGPLSEDSPPWDINPLGLVAVRAIPRTVGPRTELGFSFTWRTVEALVGLPYSLYGSIRYSLDLTEALAVAVRKVTPQHEVAVGPLSYIAHSLHLTTDSYGQNIARRIIQRAER